MTPLQELIKKLDRKKQILLNNLVPLLLKESPDTLYVFPPGATTIEESESYDYESEESVLTGIFWHDPILNTKNNFIGFQRAPHENIIIDVKDSNFNRSTARDCLEEHLPSYLDGRKSHYFLEDCIFSCLSKVYGKNGYGQHYSEPNIKIRVFLVNGTYYFTAWGDGIDLYKQHLDLFLHLIKLSDIPTDKLLFEVRMEDASSDSDRYKFLSIESLKKILGVADDSTKTESEIEKRIRDLNKELANFEADEHVKGATWNPSEKNQFKVKLLNLKAEIAALAAARASGESEIKNVVIKTIDRLGDATEYVPADVLYAELEKKLKPYGTSAVAIIQKLRDRGIDIKKALKTLAEQYGNNVTVTELMEGFEKIINETVKESKRCCKCDRPIQPNETVYRIPESDLIEHIPSCPTDPPLGEKPHERDIRIDKLKESNDMNVTALAKYSGQYSSSEEFMKSFVGKSLETLHDKISLLRLYMANKHGMMSEGETPEELVVKLLDAAVSFINFRLIAPSRKKFDDADAVDKNSPAYKKYHANKMELLKKKFAAQRTGNQQESDKYTRMYNDLPDEPSNYRKNMAVMEKEVEMIHKTPLKIDDVLPNMTDSIKDKQAWQHVVKAFENFKKTVG